MAIATAGISLHETLGRPWRPIPNFMQAAMIISVGLIVNTALCTASEAQEEVVKMVARHEANPRLLPFVFAMGGLASGMLSPDERALTTFALAMALREVQLLQLAEPSWRWTVLRVTTNTWFVPMIVGFLLSQPVESLARRQWAARVRLEFEVRELHEQIKNLETHRKEQLVAQQQKRKTKQERQRMQMQQGQASPNTGKQSPTPSPSKAQQQASAMRKRVSWGKGEN